jgi:hypothetical protein
MHAGGEETALEIEDWRLEIEDCNPWLNPAQTIKRSLQFPIFNLQSSISHAVSSLSPKTEKVARLTAPRRMC